MTDPMSRPHHFIPGETPSHPVYVTVESLDLKLVEADRRIAVAEKCYSDLRVELAANTVATQEILDLMKAVKTGFKVLGWLGTGAKWIGGIAAAASAMYVVYHQLTHGGQLPTK